MTPLHHQTRVKESPAEQIRDQWEDLRQYCLNLMRPAHNSLEVSETLLTAKKGKSSQVDIDMTNNTSHEIVLRGWTLLGRLQLVQSVTPVEVKIEEPDSSASDTQPKGVHVSGTKEPIQTVNKRLGGVPMGFPSHIRDIDLEGLTPDQKEMALQLLAEEADSFTKDNNDVGYIPNLELDLDLEDRLNHSTKRSRPTLKIC